MYVYVKIQQTDRHMGTYTYTFMHANMNTYIHAYIAGVYTHIYMYKPTQAHT